MDYSLRLLSIKSYSEKVIADKLIHKGFSTSETAQAVKKLKGYGYVDDEKYGKNLVEDGKRRLIGRIKTMYCMHKKGLSKGLIEDLLERYYTPEEEKEIASSALEKKMPGLLRFKVNGIIFKKKLYDFLQRRGFSSGIVEDILDNFGE